MHVNQSLKPTPGKSIGGTKRMATRQTAHLQGGPTAKRARDEEMKQDSEEYPVQITQEETASSFDPVHTAPPVQPSVPSTETNKKKLKKLSSIPIAED